MPRKNFRSAPAMNSANKRRIILLRIILYSLGFGLPLLVMFGGCSYYPAPSLSFSSCVIPSEMFKEYASFIFAMVLISSYMLGIPILIYVAVVVAVTEFIAWALKG